jgi:glycosyltransferase involved in cell wall biosynthesis
MKESKAESMVIERPAVTVIVPFAGTASDAAELEPNLSRIGLSKGDEVIVVDNSREQVMATGREQRPFEVIAATGIWSSYYARNCGARHAANEWLLFLDADCAPSREILDAYFAMEVSDRCGAIAGAIKPARQDEFVARYSGERGFLDQDESMSGGDRAFGATANLMVRRAAWRRLGGFAEGIRSGGDQDFCWRMRSEGWSLVTAQGAVVEHEHRTTVAGLRRQWRRYGAGLAWLRRRHPEKVDRPPYARRFAGASLRAASAALRGRREEAGFYVLDVVATFSHLVGYLGSNAATQGIPEHRMGPGQDASTRAETVAMWLPYPDHAPYLDWLRREVEQAGVVVRPLQSLDWHTALTSLREIDAAHLHWIEFLYRAEKRGPVEWLLAAQRALRLIVWLGLLRLLGKPVVWTVHNRRPHESFHRRLDGVVNRAVRALATRAIVHSVHAQRVLAEEGWPRQLVAVAPHGNFAGLYPATDRSRSDIRRELGVAPSAFVYLAFGQIRPYKQLGRLIEAVRLLPGDDVCLLIAGRAVTSEIGEQLRSRAEGDPRVLVADQHVPDARVAEYHAAADAAVFAYDEIFTSGALLLALTHGLPVVAPARGSATEIATPPAIETFDPGELFEALKAIRIGDQEARRRAATSSAMSARWDRMKAAVLDAYGAVSR